MGALVAVGMGADAAVDADLGDLGCSDRSPLSISDVCGMFDDATHGDGQTRDLGMADRTGAVDRAANDEIARPNRQFDKLRHDAAGAAKAGVNVQTRSGSAVFSQMKIGGVEVFGDIGALVDAQKEERHDLGPVALQGGGAVTRRFKVDAKPGDEGIKVVFRRPRLGHVGFRGDQDGGGETVGQFHAQAGDAGGCGPGGFGQGEQLVTGGGIGAMQPQKAGGEVGGVDEGRAPGADRDGRL